MPQAVDLSTTQDNAEAVFASIGDTLAEVLTTFRAPQMRGPFPYPSAAELARPAYLRELAQWGRASALRSRKTLGARGVDEVLEAAARLQRAAALLAQSAPAVEGAGGASSRAG